MTEVRRADELDEHTRAGLGKIFVDGFGEHLDFFAKDHDRLAGALTHALVPSLFHVALVDGRPAAIAACTDGVRLSFRHDGRILRRELGTVRGALADQVFRRTFQKPWTTTTSGTASIEFVATATEFRGRGVATALISHLLTLPEYHTYVLEEVADTNAPAIALYQKLGFREFTRKKVRHFGRTGINYYASFTLEQK